MQPPLFAACLFAGLIALPAPPIEVTQEARSLQPGEVVSLMIATAAPVAVLHARAFGHDLRAFKVSATTWRALAGIDLDVTPGQYDVTIEAGPPLSSTVTHPLAVLDKRFPTRRLTVAPSFVNPPAAVQDRIEDEARLLASLWDGSVDTPLWTGAFTRPVPQTANSAFGTRSVFNGQPRSPHGGADFASPAGTPVRAPSAGRILLARSLYYTGNTVVLDHGAGIVSLFAHLSSMTVTEQETVREQDVIGEVGATGRVTGPHLHWAVRAHGARVDPLSLMAALGR